MICLITTITKFTHLRDPRAYLDDSLFYNDRQTNYKGGSMKHGKNPKAIKARRKKNKNKKTHRR